MPLLLQTTGPSGDQTCCKNDKDRFKIIVLYSHTVYYTSVSLKNVPACYFELTQEQFEQARHVVMDVSC